MAEKAVSRKRKRRSRSVSRELMSCWGEVTGWDTSLSVLPMRGSGVTHLESMQSIEIRGRLCSPVKRVDTFQILAFPRAELDRSKDGATSVGSILSMRSALDAAMHLTDPEFQHLLTTATPLRSRRDRFGFLQHSPAGG